MDKIWSVGFGRLGSVVAWVIFASSHSGFAASDTWNQSGGTHDWRNGANWFSGTQFPNGSGDVANFTNDLTSAQIVTNGSAVTVGGINVGDSTGASFSFTIGTATQNINLDNGSSASVINSSVGANTILAKLVATGANKDLTVNVTGGSFAIGTSSSPQSPMNIDTLTINMSGSPTVTLGTSGSTYTDTNVFISGAGSVFIGGSQSLSTNAIVRLSNGALLAGGGGRDQDVAEIWGVGTFRPSGNSRFLVGSPTANYGSIGYGGVTVTNAGRLRPGDISGPGGIGTLAIGTTGGPAAPHLEVGGRYYFDIASYSSFDTIDIPRTTTTVNGGDVIIDLLGSFQPTNNARFTMFTDTSTMGYKDGNGGLLFDNILNADTGSTNFFYPDDRFIAAFGAAPLANENPGGLGGREIVFIYLIPEPAVTGLVSLVVLAYRLRRRSS